MSKRKNALRFAGLLCFAATVCMTAVSSTVAREARRGIELCLSAVLPSLFPIFVMNGLMTRLGAAEMIARPLRPVLSLIFGVPPSCAYPVTIGLISGAPSGVIALRASVEDGLTDASEAEASALVCSPLSFAFVYGAIGTGMLDSEKQGLLLYLIQLVSMAIASRLASVGKKSKKSLRRKEAAAPLPLSEAFSLSLKTSLDSVINVSGTVIFFSVLSGIVMAIPILPKTLRLALSVLLEVTSGAAAVCTELSGASAFVCLCAAIGWSGLSVIGQCANASSGRFSLSRLLLGRALTSVISVLLGICAVFLGLI